MAAQWVRQRNVRRAFMGLKTFMKLSQLLNYGTTVKVLRPISSCLQRPATRARAAWRTSDPAGSCLQRGARG
jgi:hypothetical protein